MKVLVVDDEPAIQRISVRWLQTAGHACQGASTAAEAREFLAGDAFDIALLDVGLGDESGLTLARLIQKGHPETVVIMVTGAADFTSVSDARLAGALDYLVKPVEGSVLLEAVQRAAEVRQRRTKGTPGPRRTEPARRNEEATFPTIPAAALTPAPTLKG